MSDAQMGGAPAPAQSATPTPAPAGNVNRAALIERIMASPKAGEVPVAPAEPEATPEPAEAAAEAPAELEAAPEAEAPAEAPAADPEPAAKPKPENARLAKALVDLEREQAARMKLEKRFKEFETKLAAAKDDPQALFDLSGVDGDSFIAKLIDKAAKKPAEPELTPEQKALKEVQDEVARLKQERDDALAKETYRQEVATITEKLKDRPIASVYPWAADTIYRNFYSEYQKTGEVPDLDSVIEKFEDGVAADLRSALSSERALKTLTSDAQVREMVVKALGLSPAPATEKRQPARQEKPRATTEAPADGPSVITPAMAAEVPARAASERKSADERRAASIARLLSVRGSSK
jgi:hypothetical protein